MGVQYSIATNWDSALLDNLEGTAVSSLYGQAWGDPLGGGRMLIFIPRVYKEEAKDFISETRRRGLSFNYIINATCFDNEEFTKKGHKRIMEHLEWISSTGADMVTVSLPFLIQLIKKNFPQLKVSISSFARINSVYLARFWEEMGADKIILPESVTRDFKTLGLIREGVDCELEVIANHCCLYNCPFDLHHRNMVSHGSQNSHPSGGFAVDYCKLSCQRRKLFRPSEFLRSCWIRPEDIGYYEDAGIDCIKLVERFRGTESLIRILNAYELRSYPGNLAEILTLPQEGIYIQPNLDLIDRPDLIEKEKMDRIMGVLREPFPQKVYIDNTRLDGFLDHIKKIDCLHTDCEICGYCEKIAGRAVTIDEDWRMEMIEKFDKAIEVLQ